MKIIDFFDKSLDGLTIDCMYLACYGDPGTSFYYTSMPWWQLMDDYVTIE